MNGGFMKKQSKKTDEQVNEFHKKDLGNDIGKSRSATVIKSKTRQMPTSIMLDKSLIAKLKEKAQQRGIGYQTMLKIILHEHVDEY
jgi:predicted DNA binding CopG/RHH family protein